MAESFCRKMLYYFYRSATFNIATDMQGKDMYFKKYVHF